MKRHNGCRFCRRSLAPLMDIPLLQVQRLSFSRRERPVLQGINLYLDAGSCTLISGDNGAGKSTLLQLLQGRLQPDAGWVRLAGQPLRGQCRRLALVTQSPPLRWHYPICVADLVGLGCSGPTQLVERALEQVGLTALARAAIATLSEGQRQRALVARAVARQAEVLLLDEPLACLDATSRLQLGTLLTELARAGTAVVFTAHGALPSSFQHLEHLHLQAGRLHRGELR